MANKEKKKLVVLAAGGTGGHIFPAQALCSALIKNKYKPFLICDERTEKFLQEPLNHIENYRIISSQFSGSLLQKIKCIFFILVSSILVTIKLLKLKPSLVIGFGGYPSFPSLLAAIILRIPFIIHEQNAVLGRVNRIFARFATKVLLSFPHTKHSPKKNSLVTGNFVRPEIISAKTASRKAEKIYLLVIGGSQGAKILSDIIPEAIILLPKSIQNRLIIHQQARPNLLDSTTSFYERSTANVTVKDFFINIGELLKQADLVICRSGASTISELIALGKPAIFIPYKHAKDNHQFYNAKYLVDKTAALLIEEDKLTANILQAEILKLINKPKTLLAMGKSTRSLGKANSVKSVLSIIAKIA